MKNLDWKAIKKECPKSFKLLVKEHETIEVWGYIDNPEIWGEFVEEEHYVMRHLYDFFDKKNVIIEIGVDHTRSGYGQPLFSYQINVFGKGEYQDKCSELFGTRPEAEVAAWSEAFKILEASILKLS